MLMYNQQPKSLTFKQFWILLIKTTKKSKKKKVKTCQIKSEKYKNTTKKILKIK